MGPNVQEDRVADERLANHDVANEPPKLRYAPKEVMAATERLLQNISSTEPIWGNLQNTLMFSKIQAVTQRTDFSGQTHVPVRSTEDELIAIRFEEDIWNMYGLTGEIVPDNLLKESQRRLRETEPGSRDQTERQQELDALDSIRSYRKRRSIAFSRTYPEEMWRSAQYVPPCAQFLRAGRRFWAVIIGNNDYPDSPLGGCVNDALLVQKHLINYLGVPADHIRLLLNATRRSMVDALYDLRDDERIEPGDNILIHYSGHGSSFECREYFTTPASQAGCIEAICPVDRSDTIPDISERELNSSLSELGAAKGPNITIILDCCHSGGAVRSLDLDNSVRFNLNKHGLSDRQGLELMFQAADNNPRRHSHVSTASEIWNPELSSFVLLAACQDFELAVENNFQMSESAPRTVMLAKPRVSQRYGLFTWALVKVLESEEGRTATYESVVTQLIGRLGRMQMPLAAGTRKASQLWFN